jgi:hypothetical protein
VNTKGAFWKALAAVLIVYVIGVSSVADILAHQCGRYWFEYTFQLSIASSWMFGVLGVVIFLICLLRHVGTAVQWWFFLAVAVIVLVANGAYAATVPASLSNEQGDVQCAVRR